MGNHRSRLEPQTENLENPAALPAAESGSVARRRCAVALSLAIVESSGCAGSWGGGAVEFEWNEFRREKKKDRSPKLLKIVFKGLANWIGKSIFVCSRSK